MPALAINATCLHYDVYGDGPPILFIHGSVTNGAMTWSAQQPLADRWRMVVIDRPGFGASSPVARVDFEVDAEIVAAILDRASEVCGADQVHLVGESYGGVISLLVAARRLGAVRSLTVIEPPAFDIASENTALADFVTRAKAHWQNGPQADPAAFLRQFLRLIGSTEELPDPLPAPLAQGAEMLVIERRPWEAKIPLGALAEAPFPKLVVSGAHSAAFDAVCDVLEHEIRAERAVISGAGHNVAGTGERFNRRLETFIMSAQD